MYGTQKPDILALHVTTNDEGRNMTVLIGLHTFGGSLSEAADPQEIVAVATWDEATEVVDGYRAMQAARADDYVTDYVDVRGVTVPETMSAAEALQKLLDTTAERWGEDED
jgi:hypothetical protein